MKNASPDRKSFLKKASGLFRNELAFVGSTFRTFIISGNICPGSSRRNVILCITVICIVYIATAVTLHSFYHSAPPMESL